MSHNNIRVWIQRPEWFIYDCVLFSAELEACMFLHASNYSMEAAKACMDAHHTTRTHVPEFFANRDVNGDDVKNQMKIMWVYAKLVWLRRKVSSLHSKRVREWESYGNIRWGHRRVQILNECNEFTVPGSANKTAYQKDSIDPWYWIPWWGSFIIVLRLINHPIPRSYNISVLFGKLHPILGTKGKKKQQTTRSCSSFEACHSFNLAYAASFASNK